MASRLFDAYNPFVLDLDECCGGRHRGSTDASSFERDNGSRMTTGDTTGSESGVVFDIEPDGMSVPPHAARDQPTRHSDTVWLDDEPSASEETPTHVPTARPSCQGLSAQPPSGQPQPGRPHGQTAAPSKPSVFRPEVRPDARPEARPEARPDAELAARLAARLAVRLDGAAASQSSEEPAKPRATYSPDQLRLLQVRGVRYRMQPEGRTVEAYGTGCNLRQLQACCACVCRQGPRECGRALVAPRCLRS